MRIADLQKEIFDWAVEKGWWPIKEVIAYDHEGYTLATKKVADLERVNIAEKLMLMVSELSEAMEEDRNDMPYLYCKGYNEAADGGEKEGLWIGAKAVEELGDKPEGIAIELADCVIRILDLAEALSIDMEEAIRIKMNYNRTRSYKHGGKKY